MASSRSGHWQELPWQELQRDGRLPARVCDYLEQRGLHCYEHRRGCQSCGFFIDDEMPSGVVREGFPTLARAASFAITLAADLAALALAALREFEAEKRRVSAIPVGMAEETGASKPHPPCAADALRPAPAPGDPRRPAPPQ